LDLGPWTLDPENPGTQQTHFFHADYLGSVRLVTDVTGAVVWSERYKPFGSAETQSGSITNDYRFTGKAWDAEAGLFYFNARWQDPDTGRFISEDPLWGNILDPQSLNRFAYGRNNPFRYTDPMGRNFEGSDDDLMDPYGRDYYDDAGDGEIHYVDVNYESYDDPWDELTELYVGMSIEGIEMDRKLEGALEELKRLGGKNKELQKEIERLKGQEAALRIARNALFNTAVAVAFVPADIGYIAIQVSMGFGLNLSYQALYEVTGINQRIDDIKDTIIESSPYPSDYNPAP